DVATRAAVERVVAAIATQDVVAAEPADHLWPSGSNEDVAPGRPDDRAALVRRRERPGNARQAPGRPAGRVRDVDLRRVVRGARKEQLAAVARPGGVPLVRAASLGDLWI